VLKTVVVVALLSSLALAQQPSFGVHLLKPDKKVEWSPAAQTQADKDYESACSVFERETKLKVRPEFTLVLGAEKDILLIDEATGNHYEIQLRKWDEAKFIEGVLRLAGYQVFARVKLSEMVKTAHAWANASIDVSDLQKEK
jgi:hypothetical protein